MELDWRVFASAEAAAWTQALLSAGAIVAAVLLYGRERSDDRKIANGRRKFVLGRTAREIMRAVSAMDANMRWLNADPQPVGWLSDSALRMMERVSAEKLDDILELLDEYAHPGDYVLAIFTGQCHFFSEALDSLRKTAADANAVAETRAMAAENVRHACSEASEMGRRVEAVLTALLGSSVELKPGDDLRPWMRISPELPSTKRLKE